jgi:nuclear pore complex protein Nup155
MLSIFVRFPELQLTDRVECLTLAVGNAKSHPVSLDGHHESAIAFLANLEEKLEVAQVQLQIWDALQVHLSDSVAVAEHISQLTQRLFNISDVGRFPASEIPSSSHFPALPQIC